jgi:hypothetical protein
MELPMDFYISMTPKQMLAWQTVESLSKNGSSFAQPASFAEH